MFFAASAAVFFGGLGACSLVTSLDGLQSGAGPSADASVDVAIADTSPIDSPLTTPEASTGLLSCNADGLVAFWPLDEGTGQTVTDCHQGISGSFSSSGVAWGMRNGGGDLEFTSTGFVTFGIVDVLNLSGPFTVAGWFRVDTLPTDYISLFWNYDGGDDTGFEITMSPTGQAYAQTGFSTAAIEAPFPTLSMGVWTHLAATFTPGVELHAYLNGVSVGATTTLNDGGLIPSSVSPDDHDVRFGADDTDSTWQGGVDDVRVFSRVLTETEISTLASQ